MPAKEAEPANAHGERFGAQKIFAAEAGIFTDDDGTGFESGASPEAEAVAADFDGTAEGGFEAGGDFAVERGVLDGEGDGFVGEPQQNQDEKDSFEPAAAGSTRDWRRFE